MSLFRASLRPPASDSHQLVRHYLEAVAARSDPDPLFRRRLRGTVLNRYVAAREGVLVEPRQKRSAMRTLGRACLVASVAIAMSVGGVMAASRTALPGEFLYPIKRELEAVRMRVLPAEFHDELALYAVGQRINEVGLLADAGDWDAVAALLPEIDSGYELLAELDALEPDGTASVSSGAEMLEQLRDGLPPPAQAAIESALDQAPGLNDGAPRGPQPTNGSRQPEDRPPLDPSGARGAGTAPALNEAEAEEPAPARSSKPKATVQWEPSGVPDAEASDEELPMDATDEAEEPEPSEDEAEDEAVEAE